jgi:hypothetical protein
MDERQTPAELREGVRAGILGALRGDVEPAAGALRACSSGGRDRSRGALGATLLVAVHPFDHHPTWHVATFSALWAGLLVVALAIALLQVRTPSLPLARSAAVGLVGLGIAGLCGAACPDGHFLDWWSSTPLGPDRRVGRARAECPLLRARHDRRLGAGSALVVSNPGARLRMRPLLPALMRLRCSRLAWCSRPWARRWASSPRGWRAARLAPTSASASGRLRALLQPG